MRSSRPKTLTAEKKFRAEIWLLDQGRCRVSGVRLLHQSDNWNCLGDVAHLKPRSTHPELKYDVHNALLMARHWHIASDGRGNYRLKILGDDARQPLTFRMHDKHGNLLWERIG